MMLYLIMMVMQPKRLIGHDDDLFSAIERLIEHSEEPDVRKHQNYHNIDITDVFNTIDIHYRIDWNYDISTSGRRIFFIGSEKK